MAQSINRAYLIESQDSATVFIGKKKILIFVVEKEQFQNFLRATEESNAYQQILTRNWCMGVSQPYQSLALVSFHAFTYSGQQTTDLLMAVTVDYLLQGKKWCCSGCVELLLIPGSILEYPELV